MGEELLYLAEKRIPVLIGHRIPDRAPPVICYPARTENVTVRVSYKESRKKGVLIKPNPGHVPGSFLENVISYLLNEAVPDNIKLLINWKGSKQYRLGLVGSIVYVAIRALETLYGETFKRDERIGILSSLLMEKGISKVESEALATCLEQEAATITSNTGEKVVYETEGLPLSFTYIVRPSLRKNVPRDREFLDLMAKVSSLTLIQLIRKLGGIEQETLQGLAVGELIVFYNSIWGTLYEITRRHPGYRENLIILPSLPGEAMVARLDWRDGYG